MEKTCGRYSACALFLLMGIFQLLAVLQGIDLTDTGWHLTNQMESFRTHVNIERVIPKAFLSDFFGGMWLNILPWPNLFWARIGGVLLCSLNTVIVFSILSAYFKRKRTFIIVLISSLFITMRLGVNIINYYSFPLLLMNLQVLLFHKLMLTPFPKRRADSLAFFIGFMAVPVILSRLSLILMLLSPAIMVLFYVITGRRLQRALRTLLWSFSGFVCAVFLFGLFYWRLGLFDSGILAFFTEEIITITAPGGHHDIGVLFARSVRQLLVMAVILACLMILALALYRSKRPVNDRVVMVALFILPIAITVVSRLNGVHVDKIAHGIITLVIGMVMLHIGLFLILTKGKEGRLMLLSIAGVMIAAVITIGSTSGLFNVYKGMWLILPLGILCMDRLKEWTGDDRFASLPSFNNAILASLLVLALFFHFTNIYRDNNNRLCLTKPFTHPALAGTFSSPQRVKSIQGFLRAMHRYSEKNDEVLMVNNVPLFYYLTGTRSAMDQSWLYRLSLDMIKRKQQQLISENRLPRLVIFSRVETRGKYARHWRKISEVCRGRDCEKLKYLKEEYISRLRYVSLWHNRVFEIYGNPAIPWQADPGQAATKSPISRQYPSRAMGGAASQP